jgi:Peptidase family M23
MDMRTVEISGRAIAFGVAFVVSATFTDAQTPAALFQRPVHLSPKLVVEAVAEPTPFPAHDGVHLAYELRLTSFDSRELRIERVEVRESGASGEVLATYEGSQLDEIIARVPQRSSTADARRIDAGGHCAAYVWLSLDSRRRPPTLLMHQITVSVAGTQEVLTIDTTVSVSRQAPVVIGAPLRGGPWYTNNGPDNDSGHRRVLFVRDGKLYAQSRFAFDWYKVKADGSGAGDPQGTYGQEVLAVADAVVAAVVDGIPDNPADKRDARSVPITWDTVSGNSVSLDLGGGRYASYGHLAPQSTRVKPGERVMRGQVIGLVGNSGNTTGAHLHFEIATSDRPGSGDGVPFVFESFELFAKVGEGPNWREQTVRFAEGERTRRREMPLNRMVIRFPAK